MINNKEMYPVANDAEQNKPEIWIRINGKEKRLDNDENLSFERWCYVNDKLHLLGSYCSDNEIPRGNPTLLWNDKRKVTWHCFRGHTWEQSVFNQTKETKRKSFTACPVCKEFRRTHSPKKMKQQIDEIINLINSGSLYVTDYEDYSKDIKFTYKYPTNKHGRLWRKG